MREIRRGYLVVERQDRVEVEGLLDIVGLGGERDVGGAEHTLADVEDLVHPWKLHHKQLSQKGNQELRCRPECTSPAVKTWSSGVSRGDQHCVSQDDMTHPWRQCHVSADLILQSAQVSRQGAMTSLPCI